MARKVNNMNELKPGDKVFMFTADFPATVLGVGKIDFTVKVKDYNNVNTHYLAITRLLKAAPYTVDATYQDSDGDTYTFLTDTDVNAWKTSGGYFKNYDYPSRPLRLVTFGPELTD